MRFLPTNFRCLPAWAFLLAAALGGRAAAGDWPSWRGPQQDGTAEASGLISNWEVDGENQIWRAEFTGRSTPVAFEGRVCAIGRSELGGQHINKAERIACFDAQTGSLLWQREMPVFLTTVPFTRAGWASVAADPETGYIFSHGVGGTFAAFDREGNIVWEHSLTEEFSRFSGYGGRTHTPIVDGDLVILSFGVVGGWGSLAPPRHRYFAFDKRNGQLVWMAQPGGAPRDLNTYAVPVTATIQGQRLLIHGNGDGWIYALQADTGRLAWKFHFSKRGMNTAVVVRGNRVYATHGEENVDQATMGRTVAIDATGQGDVTATHELWRNDHGSGFVSPLLHGNQLYVVDNSANMKALDIADGRTLWELSLGTVGKGSPALADGKIYSPEVNGRFLIIEPGKNQGRILDETQINMPSGRYAEIYASPAIAYGRIYLATENGLFCLGDKDRPFQVSAAPVDVRGKAADPQAQPAQLQVVPAETVLAPGQKAHFEVRAFDGKGYFLRLVEAEWELNNLKGSLEKGIFEAAPEPDFQAGLLTAKLGDLSASARLRVLKGLPLEVDFEDMEPGKSPPYFVGAAGRFAVKDLDGNKVLAQPPFSRSHNRGYFYLGPPSMSDYTVQADLRGTRVRRKRPDMGLINSRYTFQVAGNKLEIFSWISEKRVEVEEDFEWQPDVWYTMKMSVEIEGGQAMVRGKIWPRSQPEPEQWSITAADPQAISQGSPALFGVSNTEILFDNVKVTRNP